METAVRVRVVFEDRQILSKSQRMEGLKRSWILLKSHHHTISDLSSYLLHIFHLENACPYGLVLSMDGFVLPPFESITIMQDKDVVCVKKKRVSLRKVIKADDGVNSLKEAEIVEKQPVLTGVKLLAYEELEKETGGYESEPEDDEHEGSKDNVHLENTPDETTISKKRKASKKLQSSKRKKPKAAAAEECLMVNGNSENGVCAGNRSSHQHDVLIQNSSDSDEQVELEKSSAHETGKGGADASTVPSGTKQFPSRSARRKKAKRKWLREKLRMEKEELCKKDAPGNENQQSPEKKHTAGHGNQQSPEKGKHKLPEEPQQPNPISDVEDDVVPIVVRPGYIRFEPLGKVNGDQGGQQSKIPTENFQWNGITNKKKGQKWGIENSASSKRRERKNFGKEYYEMLDIEKETSVNDTIETSINDAMETLANVPVDFDQFRPCTGLPKEGDVIAYRLIELSSSWTPELSPFRVGKVSMYDSVSNRIKLLQDPEHPDASEEKIDGEASALQLDTSLYGEDGSLEVDFSSLVDVRLVKTSNTTVAESVACSVNKVLAKGQDGPTDLRPNNGEAHKPIQGNGKVDTWEEISQALNAKKAELSQEDNWNTKESSERRPWSYRALRGSALGPTMALLRSQNGGL